MTLCLLRVIILARLLQTSTALVEFTSSKLYDEFDLAVQVVNIPNNYCDVGCRVYVSIPESSSEVAKGISVHDYIQDSKSLYDISKLKKGPEKGYFDVQAGNEDLDIINTNANNATAPLAVWVLRMDADNNGYGMVFDAFTDIEREPSPHDFILITVISAEPYKLRTKTDGPMMLVSTLTGFDAITNEEDECTYVIEQMDESALSDVEIRVQSPLITLNFDDIDFPESMDVVFAERDDGNLDFDGISFAASPGYIGCKGGKTYRSSLYPATTAFTYTSANHYDVALESFLNTDTTHPVIVSGNSGQRVWSGSAADTSYKQALNLSQINSLNISWSKNENVPDQGFLVRITPSNEHLHTTPEKVVTTEPATTQAEPEPTTESVPDQPTTTEPEPTTTTSTTTTTTTMPTTTTTATTTTTTPPATTTNPTTTTTTPEIVHTSCPDGFDLVRDGECRGSVSTTSSFNDAAFNDISSSCKGIGGQPIIIHNDEHHTYWQNWRESDGSLKYSSWPIGITCNTKNKNWEWADGSRVNYKPFLFNYDSDLNRNCKKGCGWFMDTKGYWSIKCNHNSYESNVFCTTQLQQPSTKCANGPWNAGEMIYSPGFPYSSSTSCDYMLKVEAGRRVELTIVSLEANSCCDVLVLSEEGNGEKRIAKVTGAVANKVYTTKTSNVMKVSWQPKGGSNVRGVQMWFRAV
ncbi:hypothetical protein PMAYCL1PPCAC_21632 [Pristionchus mayeri]|uniref:CUB domain-containing protein n=1 Tax=Pristionchus mayeri TaxID=1317129 RepID=A0AAN5CVP1_9BILA|nr:hypothetical protein PMAYCL1PPCAC_21632 [Pristionchus mayeri]